MRAEASAESIESRFGVGWPASWLYVPADKPRLLHKAVETEAGAMVVDLEDAVPRNEKDVARANVNRWLQANCPLPTDAQGAVQGKPIWVRINADSIVEDVAALRGQAGELLCTGVVLAKADRHRVAELVTETDGQVPTICLVESALGLRSLEGMANVESVVTFGIGEVDLLADLRMRRTHAAEAAIDAIRVDIVTACAAANLCAPLAPTSTDFRDLDAFEASTRKFQDLGFRSRTAIHPAQCRVVNEVFTPTEDEISEARSIVARSDAAAGGVAVDDSGRLIDAAVVRGARETIERSAHAEPGADDGSSLPQSDLTTRRKS